MQFEYDDWLAEQCSHPPIEEWRKQMNTMGLTWQFVLRVISMSGISSLAPPLIIRCIHETDLHCLKNHRANNFASESVERAYAVSKISLVILLSALAKIKKNCTSRESNPGLNRGRVLFYH